MENNKILLEVKDLHTGFRIKDSYFDAVDGISFTLSKNEKLAIVGESGCGKSTLATSIVGLHNRLNTRITGEIIYNNENLVEYNETKYNQIRGNDIGMIFQDPLASLNPLMTIEDQIDEALFYHTKLNKKQRQERVLELLDQVGIANPVRMAAQYPHELSGGMRQRVIIAIALACKPPIIIADEPTTALDVTIQAQILDLLNDIQDETESGIILITHDLGVVAETADRVAVMYAGKIVEIGTAEEIFYDPRHPYTWGLLQSLPILAGEKEWLPTLPGMPPTLIHPPKGDAFAERNVYAMKIDYEKEPPMFRVTDTHYAATWLLDERAPKVKVPTGGQRDGE